MTANDSTRSSMPLSSNANARRSDAASTFAPMQATAAPRTFASSSPTATSPHVVGRHKEAELKRRDPKKRARRWIVEGANRWFNRFRKFIVRYEKLERSFLALN